MFEFSINMHSDNNLILQNIIEMKQQKILNNNKFNVTKDNLKENMWLIIKNQLI